MNTALPHCPRCDTAPELGGYIESSYHCPGCYDGAPDSGPQMAAAGRTDAEAAEAWRELVLDELADMLPS